MCISNATKNSGNANETGSENRQIVQQHDAETFDSVEELVDYVEEVVEEMSDQYPGRGQDAKCKDKLKTKQYEQIIEQTKG